jgi:hypothetical protein
MIVVDSDVRRDRKMIEHPRRSAADFENTITGPRSNELVNQPLPGTPGADGRLKCIVYAGDGKQAPRSLLPLTPHPCRGSHSCPYHIELTCTTRCRPCDRVSSSN